MEPANEILESASHDRPFVSKNYSAAATKDTYSTSPTSHGKTPVSAYLWVSFFNFCFLSVVHVNTLKFSLVGQVFHP